MNKRPLLTGMLALSMLVAAAPAPNVLADTDRIVRVQLNDQPMHLTIPPQLSGSTLMVPFRDLSEALGVQVQWNESEQSVTAVKGDRSARLTVGSKSAERAGKPLQLEEAPLLVDSRVLVPLRFFSETFDFNVYWDGLNRSVAVVDADKSLPTVGSKEHMDELLKSVDNSSMLNRGVAIMPLSDQAVAMKQAVPAASAAAEAKSAAPAAPSAIQDSAGYSRTNVQVQGVDEADVIKTDGKYIYQVNQRRIIVAQAVPADHMSVASTVYFEDSHFNPREIYVDDNHLVVIGTTYYADPPADQPTAKPVPLDSSAPAVQAVPAPGIAEKKLIARPIYTRSTTKTIVYDLTDRTHLKKIRETELEGNYVSSRKIGSSLYVVANKGLNLYPVLYHSADSSVSGGNGQPSLLPAYRDSAAGDNFIEIGYEDIRYFPQSVQPNYLLVGGMNLDQTDQKMQVSSYLGSGQNVYASEHSLYVSVSQYEPVAQDQSTPNPADTSMPVKRILPAASEASSVIYKFGLDGGAVTYKGRGKVLGTVLNQYSMDEQNGYFRIATTKGDTWRTDEYTSKNNVYVLDETMKVTGKLEDIAPGERIYSVRYAGDRAYMVTFKQTDPLFVLDLKDPQAPKIMGQLKIPGYSDYLQPYDENHIIGFGKEAIEVPNKNSGIAGTATTAYYQGMKLAMFDVTDVTQPKEMFKETIGDRGTDSELLYNPKALLFSKEKNVLAFPVTVAEASPSANATAYGQFVFQGAYVYSLDLTNGFQLRGKVTHLTSDDLQKAGHGWYGSDRNIDRLLYIGDTLYSSSRSLLKANDLSTLKETGTLTLPSAAHNGR